MFTHRCPGILASAQKQIRHPPSSHPHPSAASLSRTAGADVVGDEDLVARILESGGGGLQFDKCIATPDMMPRLSKVGNRGCGGGWGVYVKGGLHMLG